MLHRESAPDGEKVHAYLEKSHLCYEAERACQDRIEDQCFGSLDLLHSQRVTASRNVFKHTLLRLSIKDVLASSFKRPVSKPFPAAGC